MSFLHDATFYLLYAALALVVYLTIERTIFYAAARKNLGRFIQMAPKGSDDLQSDDVIECAFIRAQEQLGRNLWMFDTIITAAPLLGLLGTILGIFDTFTALAKSGISDPQGVSAGIGAALLATALGISTALLGLVVFNVLNAWMERLSNEVKCLLMRSANKHLI